MDISGLPGFRDFFPEELALRRHIFSVWRETAERYGFAEYDGPPLEPLELYTRKSGEEIVGQLYAFTDKGGREVALRPEMTPSFARMIAGRAASLPKPIRWFSMPQLFRYERPQKGRLREHFQLNLDIVGETGVAADAEVVAAGLDVLRGCGLGSGDVFARVSDRRLMGSVLQTCGVPAEGLAACFVALDRAESGGQEKLLARLAELGLDDEAVRRIASLPDLDLKGVLERYGDSPGVAEAGDRLERFFSFMRGYGLEEFVAFDAGLVRGLAYYTGTVFELWDRGRELRAICGGGRYDDLLLALGGVDLPAVGFGMGDVVLAEILRERDLIPGVPAAVQDFVIVVEPEGRVDALRIVRRLRDSGRRVAFDLPERSVGRQFKAADQSGASRAIVLGPDELERGVAKVRSLDSGDEREVPVEELA